MKEAGQVGHGTIGHQERWLYTKSMVRMPALQIEQNDRFSLSV